MAIKTAAEMFGDGGGFGPAVPYSTSNAPGTSAGNRGIQFGEQLTAAIANRTHYALALNDQDLNTRLAAFEAGGLDAAYDNGTIGPAGGGRDIAKDGGAVETVSALASQYADDRANAHFRANMNGDSIGGGTGFDAVSFGRSGVSALFGFLDRRGLSFSGTTVLTDTVAATLTNPNAITIGAGQWYDGSTNRDIAQGYDMVQILSGNNQGLYVIEGATTSTTILVRALDGSTPSFTAGAVTIRVFRPIFASVSPFGHTGGANQYAGTTMMGSPGTEVALELVPGSKDGRLAAPGSTTDGARYALRIQHRRATGGKDNVLEIDSHGQIRSLVTAANLTTAQRQQALNFGAAIVLEQDSAFFESGVIARHEGALPNWLGLASMGVAKPASTPGGVFDFNFINVAPYNVQLTDTVATDWHVNPSLTLVEIVTPTAQAGVYAVAGRAATNGRLELVTLAGGAPASWPVVGAGTMRIFYGAALGIRDFNVVTALLASHATTGKAAATIMAPKQVGGTALLLEAGRQSGSPVNHFLLRGVSSASGVTREVASLTTRGDLAVAGGVQAASPFTFLPRPSNQKVIFPAHMVLLSAAGVSDWECNIAGNVDILQPRSAGVLLAIPLDLPTGATLVKVVALVRSSASRVTATDRWRVQVFKRTIDWVTAAAPTSVQQGADQYNPNTVGYEFAQVTTGPTVAFGEDVFVVIRAPLTSIGANDQLLAVAVVFEDPGPSNVH